MEKEIMSNSDSKTVYVAEDFSHIHGHDRKSIEVEPEIWDQLNRWSEQECRTVAGQIKYLVKHYAPSLKTPENSCSSQLEISLKPIRKKRINRSRTENGWEYVPLRLTHLKRATQRMGLLVAIVEYDEPFTNTDLLLLAQAKFPNWSALNINVVTKQTSHLFYNGMLKRRDSQNLNKPDRYQYILQPRAMRLVNRAMDRTKKVNFAPLTTALRSLKKA